MNVLLRVLNEAPVVTAAVLSLLWAVGVIDPVDAERWLEVVGGLAAAVLSVVFRQNNNGPVTLWRNRQG